MQINRKGLLWIAMFDRFVVAAFDRKQDEYVACCHLFDSKTRKNVFLTLRSCTTHNAQSCNRHCYKQIGVKMLVRNRSFTQHGAGSLRIIISRGSGADIGLPLYLHPSVLGGQNLRFTPVPVITDWNHSGCRHPKGYSTSCTWCYFFLLL